MKNTIKPTLTPRAHSIRNLTATELRVAHGGVNNPQPQPPAPHRRGLAVPDLDANGH